MRYALCFVSLASCLSSLQAQTISPDEIDRLQAEQYAELDRYFDRQVAEAEEQRREALQRDTSSIAAYEKSIEPLRAKLWEVYGGRPYDAPPLDAKEELLAEFPTHTAYRVWLTSFEKVRQYGILLVPKGLNPGERRPALICVHGMAGTPEGVCGLTDKPDYHNRFGQQAAERGYVVFATLNMNNAQKQSWLDRKGTMIGQRMHALEVHKTTRAVDYLCARGDVAAERQAPRARPVRRRGAPC